MHSISREAVTMTHFCNGLMYQSVLSNLHISRKNSETRTLHSLRFCASCVCVYLFTARMENHSNFCETFHFTFREKLFRRHLRNFFVPLNVRKYCFSHRVLHSVIVMWIEMTCSCVCCYLHSIKLIFNLVISGEISNNHFIPYC